MPDSTMASDRVRERFTEGAQQFDDLYEDERLPVRLLRPGLFRRRQLAVATVAELDAPRVLDVGCGSGRVGEFVLEAGASRYVGVDFAQPMIDLASRRLERFAPRCELLAADFLDVPLDGSFDVILALGLFDYLDEPERFTARMFELAAPGGCVVASFPAWSPLKGPVRKVRYEWIGNCPIFNYTSPQLEQMFRDSGFASTELRAPGRSGFLVRAWRGQPSSTAPPA
jgi:SAM-dependent methyltransferase